MSHTDTSTTLPITAIVLTLNEEANIEACLKSLDFCDQRLVIDSGSSDKTCSLASKMGAEVIQLPWSGFTPQRNASLEYAKNSWVFSVDADERVSPELRGELETLFSQGELEHSAFDLPRKTLHFGRWIRHGGWYPNRLVRVFRKDSGRWEGDQLHEQWVTRGRMGQLKSDLVHYSFSNLADQVQRNNLYSSLGAEKLYRMGARFSFFKLIAKSTSKFLETYIWKRGFLDGYPGLIISVSAAYSVFLKWAKLWEIQNTNRQS